MDIKQRGVYGVLNEMKLLMYIGSSTLPLHILEYNHRNCKQKNYIGTNFRNKLSQVGKDWKFFWIIKPYDCDLREIETREGELIRKYIPLLNIDKTPIKSSIKYGRIK